MPARSITSSSADFEDLTLTWHEDAKAPEQAKVDGGQVQRSDVLDMGGTLLLCCPEINYVREIARPRRSCATSARYPSALLAGIA